MSVSSYDLALTKRIFETRRKLTANRKLNTGWVLIGVVALEKSFIYSLALPRNCDSTVKNQPDQGRPRWNLN
jgi:hypothetical protein